MPGPIRDKWDEGAPWAPTVAQEWGEAVSDKADAAATEATGRYASQAQVPLDIPTYDDKPSVTHPDVVLFDAPWNGYRYWMAFTPYPTAGREDPSIVASHDGVEWEVPSGLTNPIVAQSDIAAVNHFSDTDLIYDAGNDKLVMFFRGSGGGGLERIYRSESSDGVTWTTAGATAEDQLAMVLDSPGGHGSEVLSPAVVIDPDGTWRMWTVENQEGSPGGTVHVRTSADGGSTWGAPTTCTVPSDVQPWHLDVVRVGDDPQYHMLLNGNPTVREGSHLWYLTSNDAETWAGKTYERGLALSGFDFDSWRHYRSTFVPVPGEPLAWDVWVSGLPLGYQASGDPETDPWLIGLFRGVEFDTDATFRPKPALHTISARQWANRQNLTGFLTTAIGYEVARFPADATAIAAVPGDIPWSDTDGQLSSFEVYVVWANASATEPGDVVWRLDYSLKDVGESLDLGIAETLSKVTGTALGQWLRVVTKLGEIDVPADASKSLAMRLARFGGDAEDTLSAEARAAELRLVPLP